MAKQNPFTFADKVASNPQLRSQLLNEVFTMVVDNMTEEQRNETVKKMLIDNEVEDIDQHGADDFISYVANNFPDLLTKKHDVDISLFNHVG